MGGRPAAEPAFWGYSTLAFRPAAAAAANQRGERVHEFKEMVLAMHQAGIEVILDVVFNHGGGMSGQGLFVPRGIDNAIYHYILEDDEEGLETTGCGNTVNGNHPVVRDFILHCLRYWRCCMRVDGFRFDLATILARRAHRRRPAGQSAGHRTDRGRPRAARVKIIAEAWDAAGAIQVGSFPSERWSEWNRRYRDDIRDFWRGSSALPRHVRHASALEAGPLRPWPARYKSVNYIAGHDGTTLADIVSYNEAQPGQLRRQPRRRQLPQPLGQRRARGADRRSGHPGEAPAPTEKPAGDAVPVAGRAHAAGRR